MCQSLGCPCCGNWPDAERSGQAITTDATPLWFTTSVGRATSSWNGPLRVRKSGGYEPAPLGKAGHLTVTTTNRSETPS